MLQINRQYRQEKPSSLIRGNRIQALKLMGYHYIQQNNKKFSSRLIYVLLEGLVHLYTHNTEAQLLLTGSEGDRVYVGEAIELLMKEKIEGKMMLGSQQGLNTGLEADNKNRRMEELSLENKKLKEALKEQKEKYDKEAKKGNRIYQKCQHITDLLFEMKEKHQLQKKSMEERHVNDLQAIIEENRRLSEEGLREKIIVGFLKEENERMTRQKEMKMHNNCMHFKQYQKQRPNLVHVGILNLTIQPASKHLSINKQQYNDYIEPYNKINRLSINSTQQFSILPSQKNKLESLSIIQSVYSTQFSKTSIKIDASTNVDDSESFETAESIKQKQSQSLSQSTLNRVLERRLLESQLKLKEREAQYQKLVKYYNILHDEWQEYKIQTCNNIEWLSKQLERSLLNNDASNEKKSLFCATSIDTSSESEIDRLQSSRQSTDRSMTPNNRCEDESVGLCNSFVLRQRLSQDSSSVISKEIISTYILQLMDRNCQGETKEVMIDQIGACLGWGEKQFQRIDLFRRKAKTNAHSTCEAVKEARSFKQGIGDRFYRFLTLESDTQE